MINHIYKIQINDFYFVGEINICFFFPFTRNRTLKRISNVFVFVFQKALRTEKLRSFWIYISRKKKLSYCQYIELSIFCMQKISVLKKRFLSF